MIQIISGYKICKIMQVMQKMQHLHGLAGEPVPSRPAFCTSRQIRLDFYPYLMYTNGVLIYVMAAAEQPARQLRTFILCLRQDR